MIYRNKLQSDHLSLFESLAAKLTSVVTRHREFTEMQLSEK